MILLLNFCLTCFHTWVNFVHFGLPRVHNYIISVMTKKQSYIYFYICWHILVMCSNHIFFFVFVLCFHLSTWNSNTRSARTLCKFSQLLYMLLLIFTSTFFHLFHVFKHIRFKMLTILVYRPFSALMYNICPCILTIHSHSICILVVIKNQSQLLVMMTS